MTRRRRPSDTDPAGGGAADSALDLVKETAEGGQELLPRESTAPEELRARGGVGPAAPRGHGRSIRSDIDIEQPDDETMIINMGPQHPSTHGVLRLMMELDGETVLRTKPVIGYLHTGMEKTGEELTYQQGSTNVTRMDYLSPLNNELVFSLATEALLGIELPAAGRVDPHAPGRAATGVVAPDVAGHQRHGPRVHHHDDLRVPRARAGARLLREDHRPADEPQLHPPRRHGRRPARRVGGRRRRSSSTPSTSRLDDYDAAAHRATHLPRAHRGGGGDHRRGGARPVGHRAHPALDRHRLGPAPDHALPPPTTRSTSTSSSAPTATTSTATPSASTRSASRSRSSARCSTRCPPATTGSRTRRSPRPRGPASTSRWKRSSTTSRSSPRDSRCPRARSTSPSSRPRGELGCYMVSDGSAKPYRHAHPRPRRS